MNWCHTRGHLGRLVPAVMAAPHTGLGDSHNFGRRVTRRGDWIHKPRTVAWEWLLLSAASPLRRLFDEAAAGDPLGADAFSFLPDLAFDPPAPSVEGGAVASVALAPLPTTLPGGALAEVVGRSLALWSWLGVADLHWENLVLGLGARGQLVFSPLDVEQVLADLALPTETRLLPEADPDYADLYRHAAGVRRVLPALGKPVAGADVVAIAAGYHAMLGFLERHAQSIAGVFTALPWLREAPIRVFLRATGDYVRARTEPVWPPLLDAEAEQLARGDIPYFFRLYGRPGIHWYPEPDLVRRARLPLHGDVPQLDPLLQLSRGLRSPNRAVLGEQGLFTVLGAFDHPGLTGTHRAGGVAVTFRSRSLVVEVDGEVLETRRNLSAHVGSVYLPCTCGEVASVFVPAVTSCAAAAGPGTRPVRRDR